MSKKKPQKKYPMQRKVSSHTSQPKQDTSSPPDRRALEKSLSDIGRILSEHEFESIDEANAFMQNLMATGQPLDRPAHTPLEQAQDIMYQAWDAQGARRIRLARQALSMSEDCANAYVLLAEEAAKSVEQAKEFYQKGVEAGERALGSEVFEEGVGHFWGMLETRPYMRARAGLADCLWRMGEREAAIAHYQDMLRLNPGDNQGLRYLLAHCLMDIGDDDTLKTLLAAYADDASATWMYTRALLLFRQEGASKAATAQLKEAISYNAFVPQYLLGQKAMPRRLPLYVGFGDENEAISYVAEGKPNWDQNPDALAWLRATAASSGAGGRAE
jgi:tetratricopeptide (TPR) repeat protein